MYFLQNYTVEKAAQTDPLSCLKNNPGVSVEDLMLLFRQQVSEAPIVLARWSRNPPVAAEELVRYQREMQKLEVDKLARQDFEKRKEAEKLKHKISLNDYMSKKYTPKPLSKMPHSERRHHEAHRRDHRSDRTNHASTNGGKTVPTREETKNKMIMEGDKQKLAQVIAETPTEDPACGMDDGPLSYTPPGNSPGSPEQLPTKIEENIDLAGIVKTGSSFMSLAGGSHNMLKDLDPAVSAR